METMKGAYLPGNREVDLREVEVPEPGHGQVLLKTKASSICGSDIRAIYREHLGTGPEAYQGVIGGHEPAGQVVKTGSGCGEFEEGDRAVVYHISGCGVCEDCKHGYMISCKSQQRAAYGWQRDGGHAPYLLADENTLVELPENLSYVDGAFCACAYGTCWEALRRMNVSGNDRLFITGLGPMGLAAAMLGRALGATYIAGAEITPERLELAEDLGLLDDVLDAGDDALGALHEATDGRGCEVSVDCSGSAAGRELALKGTREWGRCGFVGEGGTVEFEVSPYLIHKQITLYGSWVTSVRGMKDLVERLSRWDLHPEDICTHTFPLEDAAEAYEVADEGKCGKVCITYED